jgi:glycosyltransferase involved in cell wall biosynthesis
MPGVAVIIPTLNEVTAIATAIAELPASIVSEVIVADSGSTDGTQNAALAAGARVVNLKERGYGRACATAAGVAHPDCDIIVFMDGDGADRADLLAELVNPIQAGNFDFVIAARVRALREPHSMSVHQVVAGYVLGFAIGLLTGVRYTDMCAFRAIRRDALNRLDLKEMTYGWNIEMQIRAAQAELRVLETPFPYRCRVGGESKVAGSFRGTIRASVRIVRTFIRVARAGRQGPLASKA